MYSVLSVTTAASESNLTTLTQLKADLQLDDTQDTFLTRVIQVCSDEISVYLGRVPDEDGNVSLGRETISETFYDPYSHDSIILGRRPIGDITSINENGTTVNRLVTGSDGAITATDNTFSSTGASFTNDYVGKVFTVAGAGASGATLTTTVASVTSATEIELTDAAGTTVSSAAWTAVNPSFTSKYIVRKSAGIIMPRLGSAPSSFSVPYVNVVYTAGYLMPGETGRTLPRGIEDACIIYCRKKIDQLQEGEDFTGPLTATSIEGVGSFQFSNSSVRKGYGLPYEVRALLDKYFEPEFA